jgi:4-hydroxybenzoate polyprenyltransferase
VLAYTILISAGIISGILFFFLNVNQIVIVLLAGAITGLYSIPFIGKFSIRSLGLVKTLFVAIVWVLITTVLPLYASITDLNLNSFSLLITNFLFILPLCIVFEIKDIEDDKRAGLITLPMYFGILKTKYIALTIPISYAAFSILTYFSNGDIEYNEPAKKIANLIPFIASAFIINAVDEKRSSLFYYAVIDGLMLLQFLCTFIVYY